MSHDTPQVPTRGSWPNAGAPPPLFCRIVLPSCVQTDVLPFLAPDDALSGTGALEGAQRHPRAQILRCRRLAPPASCRCQTRTQRSRHPRKNPPPAPVAAAVGQRPGRAAPAVATLRQPCMHPCVGPTRVLQLLCPSATSVGPYQRVLMQEQNPTNIDAKASCKITPPC